MLNSKETTRRSVLQRGLAVVGLSALPWAARGAGAAMATRPDQPVAPDGMVTLRGKVFEAGTYDLGHGRPFRVEPDDLPGIVAAFRAVPVVLWTVDLDGGGILAGCLGDLTAVSLSPDGRSIIGTVRMPRWLVRGHQAKGGHGAVTMDRETGRITGLLLSHEPTKIPDARLVPVSDGA